MDKRVAPIGAPQAETRAVARLESYSAPRPLPRIFQIAKGGKLMAGIFEGETINTPSMLCVEDALDGLKALRTTSEPIAMRLRVCASGAARRWRHRTSSFSRRGSIGRTAK